MDTLDQERTLSTLSTLVSMTAAKLEEEEFARDLIIIGPTAHILRGILFERTIQKYRYYLWSVIFPLFGSSTNLSLNYSKRLRLQSDTDICIEIDKRRLPEEAKNIASVIGQCGVVKEFRTNMGSVDDFVNHFTVDFFQRRPNMLFDYAISLLLTSRRQEGVAALTNLLEMNSPNRLLPEIQRLAKVALTKVDIGAPAFRSFVANREDDNARLLFPKLKLRRG